MYTRDLKHQDYSFFLFGPRGTGKSTWLRATFPEALFIDLLPSRNYLEFAKNPSLLSQRVQAVKQDTWVIIDEVQKVPELLDEVHHLMSEHGYKRFILSGSSARKIRSKGVNLLAGRAIEYHFHCLTSHEMNFEGSLQQWVRYGTLPLVINAASDLLKEQILEAYVATYLDQEIKAEALVRNLGSFSRFLDVAALCAGQPLNVSNIARDAGISRDSARGYFTILEDTLITRKLPAFRPRAKVKETARPKVYWFDSGVLNACAGYLQQSAPRDWQGVLMEHWLYHELVAYIRINHIKGELCYWSTPSGSEIDFLWNHDDQTVLIECKAATTFHNSHLKGIKSFTETGQPYKRAIVAYAGTEKLKIGNVDILPMTELLKELYSGQVLG